ncbi:hypothetical protein scyTo_0022043 [Scyliorhinus torazame]|uniref:Uncharacterized protein n=1 Tax=Scyliorhinus torazame TaxID=75743 RepID=A0A401QB86_SCYTO|nr:hypothetical protein [Scyliorhinus torazame]
MQKLEIEFEKEALAKEASERKTELQREKRIRQDALMKKYLGHMDKKEKLRDQTMARVQLRVLMEQSIFVL